MKKKYNFQKDKMEGDFTSENKPNTDGDKAERFISTDAKQSDSHLHEYLDILYRTLSSGYCMLVISVYLVIVLNNFTKNRTQSYPDMEPTSLFLFLMGSSIAFLVYTMAHLARPPHSHTNRRSHASSFLRQGSVIFGVGSLIFFSLDSASHTVNYQCIGLLRTLTGFVTIVFFALQVFLENLFLDSLNYFKVIIITFYPRLNLTTQSGVSHFGLMNLVATNVIIWIKTVIKESLLEFRELKAEENSDNHHYHHDHIHIVKREAEDDICDDSEHFDLIFKILRASTPILFAFIIEFVLIGATVFLNMWANISDSHNGDADFDVNPRFPNPRALIKKTDWSYSSFGAVAGLIIFCFNMIALGTFFQFYSVESYIDEYIEKIMRSFTNSLGIMAAVIGSLQVKKMVTRNEKEDFGVDLFLLNLGAAFTFVYMGLGISIGTAQSADERFPASLLIVNGVLSICQIICQIILVNLLLKHETKRDDDQHPGRQMITFLVIVNFSLWFVNTFELQKSKASVVEAEVYGEFTWVWLQRLTLPIVIFFR